LYGSDDHKLSAPLEKEPYLPVRVLGVPLRLVGRGTSGKHGP
jgi:hypothetical protein